VRCSKGTYVRSLAHDIGQYLGCGAHLINLERTKSGHFSIEQCVDGATLNAADCELMSKRLLKSNCC
jgi:tRNA pseudouridine55 synthase